MSTQNGVIVILQDGVGTDLDSENAGQMPQSIDQPCFTVGEIPSCAGVESIEECSSYAPAEAMIDSFFPFLDIGAAWQCHGSPLSILLMANRQIVPRKSNKTVGIHN